MNITKEQIEKLREALVQSAGLAEVERLRQNSLLRSINAGNSIVAASALELQQDEALSILSALESESSPHVVAEPVADVLDEPAQIGSTKFGKGIAWSTVIGRAKREWKYRNSPEFAEWRENGWPKGELQAIAAPQQTATPEGFILAPNESTPTMFRQFMAAVGMMCDISEEMFADAYRDVLAAAPTPPLNTQDGVDERASQLEHLLDESGKLADWINEARPVVLDLMAALERRVRTDCTPEQIEQRPWRCSEYVAAERLLSRKPVAVVEITAAPSPPATVSSVDEKLGGEFFGTDAPDRQAGDPLSMSMFARKADYERAEFEKWYVESYLGERRDLQRSGGDGYLLSYTHAMWRVWQARATLTRSDT